MTVTQAEQWKQGGVRRGRGELEELEEVNVMQTPIPKGIDDGHASKETSTKISI